MRGAGSTPLRLAPILKTARCLAWAGWLPTTAVPGARHAIEGRVQTRTAHPRQFVGNVVQGFLVDLLLLRRGIRADDRTHSAASTETQHRRSSISCRGTPFREARHAGLTPLDFSHATRCPPDHHQFQATLCVQATLGLLADAEGPLRKNAVTSEAALIVGLSIGTYLATHRARSLPRPGACQRLSRACRSLL